jgi:hypothetical protein
MKNNIIIDTREEWVLFKPEHRDITKQLTLSCNEDNSKSYISWEDTTDFSFINVLQTKSQIYNEEEFNSVK